MDGLGRGELVGVQAGLFGLRADSQEASAVQEVHDLREDSPAYFVGTEQLYTYGRGSRRMHFQKDKGSLQNTACSTRKNKTSSVSSYGGDGDELRID